VTTAVGRVIDDDASLMSDVEYQRVLGYVRDVGFANPGALEQLRWRMTLTQRAIIAGELALRPRGNYSTAVTKHILPPTRTQVQDMMGISVGSMDRAKALVRYGIPELINACARGEVKLSTGAQVARLEPGTQQSFVTRVRDGEHPKTILRKMRAEGMVAPPAIARNKARYRYVQESAFRVLADSFDGLAVVLSSTEGLDPALTPEQAAVWRADLSKRARCVRHLLALLAARSEANDHHEGDATGAAEIHSDENRTRVARRRSRRAKTS
jgi:hypothetical protein